LPTTTIESTVYYKDIRNFFTRYTTFLSLYFFKIGYVFGLLFLLGLSTIFILNFDRYAVCGLLKSGDVIFNGGGKREYFEQFGRSGKHSILKDMIKDLKTLSISKEKIERLQKSNFNQKAKNLDKSFEIFYSSIKTKETSSCLVPNMNLQPSLSKNL